MGEAKLKLLEALHLVNEYLASFENENKLPNHHFEEITEHIHLLGVSDSFLESQAFQDIAAISAGNFVHKVRIISCECLFPINRGKILVLIFSFNKIGNTYLLVV